MIAPRLLLLGAMAFGSFAGAQTAAAPPVAGKRLAATVVPGADGARREAFVEAAESFLGTPYVFGGRSERGFDCAGLIYFAGQRAGVPLPGGGVAQYQAGNPVRDGKDLRPGDLIFLKYATRTPALKDLPIQHVILYVGELGHGEGDLLENASRAVSYGSCRGEFGVDCRELKDGARYGRFTVYLRDLLSGAL